MRLGATLYIRNTIEAVLFYREAFGLTLGYHEEFSDRSYMHAVLTKDGEEIFCVSESRNDAFVETMLRSSLKGSRPTMSYGLNFATVDEVKNVYDMLRKEGSVLLPIGAMPWSACCAEVVDKFGAYWYITV